MPYSNILLAVDRSKESNRAFERALKVCKEHDAKLIIAHVLGLSTEIDFKLIGPDDQTMDLAKENSQKFLAEFKQKAVDYGLPSVEVVLEEGTPKRTIITEIIPKVKPDLVIVGATGMGTLDRVLVGSVSEHIVRHSPVDVLVVRR